MREAVEREWILLSQAPGLVREIALRHGLTITAAKTLANREITDPREVELFLRGTLSELPDPSLLKDIDKASERIVRAGIKREPLLIYADYDADGAWWQFLINGQASPVGVSGAEIKSGEIYSLIYTVN